MSNYMIDIELPKIFDFDFIQLIPQQRAFVSKMLEKGVIKNYSLSSDRSRLWVVVEVNSPEDVKKLVRSFPIFSFIKYEVHNLLFHEANINIPQLWLN
jgi:muconolactone delta-isomerase